MHAGKTLRRPGATPLWTAFSRPNPCGVAPGLSPQNGDRVLPACIQKCIRPQIQRRRELDCRKEKIAVPILKAPPKQPKTTVVQLRLDDEARERLTKYAEFLDCSPSHVVTEALKHVCQKDKEFQSWLSDQHTKTADPTTKGESFQLELK
jgi:predicted transcriptional regulator